MATTILDAVAIAAENVVPTFTVSSGSNRRVFVLVGRAHGSDANPPTSCTLGGVAMTTIATADDTSWDVCWRLFGLVESELASVADSTISLSGGAYTYQQVITWSVQGAHQTSITTATGTVNGTTNSISLVRAADSYTLAFTLHDFGASNGFSGLAEPSQDSQWRLTLGNYAYGEEADTDRTASFTWTHTNTQNNSTIAINIPPAAASGPTISSLGDTTPNYLGSTTIIGTGLPTAITGSAGATLGGVAQTLTPNTSTECSIASIARGNLAYGNYNLVVTDAAGNASANYATSLSPQAGWKHITTSGTLAAAGSRITTTPTDVVSGNQIAVGNVVGGTIDDVTLYVDGSYSCAPGVVSFQYEVHDGSVWGDLGTEYPNSSGTGNLLSLARPLAIPLATNLNGG